MLDVMAYDLDEPDIIRVLIALGDCICIIVDGADLHIGVHALEPKAVAAIKRSAGDGRVKVGRFSRYQHNKVFILRVDGLVRYVLTGSTNFSVAGLYLTSSPA